MANLMKPPINSSSANPTGVNTAANSTCESKSEPKKSRILTKTQQKALNNFLYGRQLPLAR